MLPIRQPGRRALAGAAITALVAATLVVAQAQPARADVACDVAYEKTWDAGTGFGVKIAIRNLGSPLTSWVLAFTFPGDQRVTWGWWATWRQENRIVTAASLPWNGNLATGSSVAIGFNGSYTGVNNNPTSFTINGVPCIGVPLPPTVIVTPASLRVAEGSSATFGVRLSGPPATWCSSRRTSTRRSGAARPI